jgi:hypothetical protein
VFTFYTDLKKITAMECEMQERKYQNKHSLSVLGRPDGSKLLITHPWVMNTTRRCISMLFKRTLSADIAQPFLNFLVFPSAMDILGLLNN